MGQDEASLVLMVESMFQKKPTLWAGTLLLLLHSFGQSKWQGIPDPKSEKLDSTSLQGSTLCQRVWIWSPRVGTINAISLSSQNWRKSWRLSSQKARDSGMLENCLWRQLVSDLLKVFLSGWRNSSIFKSWGSPEIPPWPPTLATEDTTSRLAFVLEMMLHDWVAIFRAKCGCGFPRKGTEAGIHANLLSRHQTSDRSNAISTRWIYWRDFSFCLHIFLKFL